MVHIISKEKKFEFEKKVGANKHPRFLLILCTSVYRRVNLPIDDHSDDANRLEDGSDGRRESRPRKAPKVRQSDPIPSRLFTKRG